MGGLRAYHRHMRKWLAVFVVLFSCLTWVGQAAASASAGYSDCCLQGCKGMSQCASAGCQACAAPQPAPLMGLPVTPVVEAPRWRPAQAAFDTGPCRGPWTPPD